MMIPGLVALPRLSVIVCVLKVIVSAPPTSNWSSCLLYWNEMGWELGEETSRSRIWNEPAMVKPPPYERDAVLRHREGKVQAGGDVVQGRLAEIIGLARQGHVARDRVGTLGARVFDGDVAGDLEPLELRVLGDRLGHLQPRQGEARRVGDDVVGTADLGRQPLRQRAELREIGRPLHLHLRVHRRPLVRVVEIERAEGELTPATETATEPENVGVIETPLVLMSWGMSIFRLLISSVFLAIGKARHLRSRHGDARDRELLVDLEEGIGAVRGDRG